MSETAPQIASIPQHNDNNYAVGLYHSTSNNNRFMNRQIYINLPVKDLQRSMTFYSRLGFTFNSRFTDEKAACMIVGENIFVMLLLEEFFRTFTRKGIADAHATTEAILAISADSRQAVDEMVDRAIDAGGSSLLPAQDHGWMYGRGFADVDGHMWETLYMDASALPDDGL